MGGPPAKGAPDLASSGKRLSVINFGGRSCHEDKANLLGTPKDASSAVGGQLAPPDAGRGDVANRDSIVDYGEEETKESEDTRSAGVVNQHEPTARSVFYCPSCSSVRKLGSRFRYHFEYLKSVRLAAICHTVVVKNKCDCGREVAERFGTAKSGLEKGDSSDADSEEFEEECFDDDPPARTHPLRYVTVDPPCERVQKPKTSEFTSGYKDGYVIKGYSGNAATLNKINLNMIAIWDTIEVLERERTLMMTSTDEKTYFMCDEYRKLTDRLNLQDTLMEKNVKTRRDLIEKKRVEYPKCDLFHKAHGYVNQKLCDIAFKDHGKLLKGVDNLKGEVKGALKEGIDTMMDQIQGEEDARKEREKQNDDFQMDLVLDPIALPSNCCMTHKLNLSAITRVGGEGFNVYEPFNSLTQAELTGNLVAKDCGGAPFCGYVAVDIAMGRKIDLKSYKSWLVEAKTSLHGSGRASVISLYCRRNGYNVMFLDEYGRVLDTNIHDITWEVIVLQNNGKKHWLLLTTDRANNMVETERISFETNLKSTRDTIGYLTDLCVEKNTCRGSLEEVIKPTRNYLRRWRSRFMHRLAMSGSCDVDARCVRNITYPNDSERRNPKQARDRNEKVDSIDVYEITVHYNMFYLFKQEFKCEVKNSVLASIYSHSNLESLRASKLPVTPAVSATVLRNMERINGDARYTHFSTNSFNTRVFFSKDFEVVDNEPHLDSVYTVSPLRNLIDIDRIREQQLIGHGGLDLLGKPQIVNYVSSARKPVLFKAPALEDSLAGLCVTKNGRKIANGAKPTPCDGANLVAAAGRTQSADDTAIKRVLCELDKHAHELLPAMCARTDVSQCVEVPFELAFEECYKGKRSRAWIDRKLTQYADWRSGNMSRGKRKIFESFSAFTKAEHSQKTKLEKGYPVAYLRARLIMTMSDLTLIQAVQMVKICDAWNHGIMSRFQLKDLAVDEAFAKVLECCNGNHGVTDFSSFEGSISYRIRKYEQLVLTILMEKAGFSETLEHCKELFADERKLVMNSFIFNIHSRCSGDFLTSTGNGIVNLVLQTFLARKNGVKMADMLSHMVMVLEGDDGLVLNPGSGAVKVMRDVGFKFSSSMVGTKPGDCDFLSERWLYEGKLMNVPKALVNTLHIRGGHKLKLTKRRFLLRVKAYSLWLRSPNHPILNPLVVKIGRYTSGVVKFKGWERYVDHWKNEHKISIENFPSEVNVSEELRVYLAEGTSEFPPISVPEQLAIEANIMSESTSIEIGTLFDDYPIFNSFESFDTYNPPNAGDETPTKGVEELLNLMAITVPHWRGIIHETYNG